LAKALLEAQPNPAHLALARLEALGLLTVIVTQNIDMLHERAGSRHVLEIHGHLREATCIHCYRTASAAGLMRRWLEEAVLPRCEVCGHVMKPNVILFGEQLPVLVFNEAKLAVKQCDLILVAGSSLEVFPAAELPLLAVERGAKLIVVNREPAFLDQRAAVLIRADVAEALPMLADEVSHVSRP
jgi:NAD-dependent deacetylase